MGGLTLDALNAILATRPLEVSPPPIWQAARIFQNEFKGQCFMREKQGPALEG